MADLKKLAEQIVGLTLLEAAELKKILKDDYGIEPERVTVIPPGVDPSRCRIPERGRWSCEPAC